MTSEPARVSIIAFAVLEVLAVWHFTGDKKCHYLAYALQQLRWS